MQYGLGWTAILSCVLILSSNTCLAQDSGTLWKAVSSLHEPDGCGMGSCNTKLLKLTCTWSNRSKVRNSNCSYLGINENKREVSGLNALKLAKAVQNANKSAVSCDSKNCSIVVAQDVTCTHGNPRTLNHVTCTADDHQPDNLGGGVIPEGDDAHSRDATK